MIDRLSIVPVINYWNRKFKMERLAIWLGCIGIRRLKPHHRIMLVNTLLPMGNITEQRLGQLGLDFEQIHQFFKATNQIDAVLHWLEQPSNHIVTLNDDRYPALLAETIDCPLLLYITGSIDCLAASKLAIVGSRACSHYGKQWARHFADVLSQAGLIITSGLAIGIDAIAHQAAVANQKPTLAILGNGLNSIYPTQHHKLAERILATQGALVSEFPLDSAPLAKHFPRRNRIISGLSSAVLIVEATQRSGSLITARCALEQNRSIYAIPGAIGRPESAGVNWLIQQGAYLVTTPEEILADKLVACDITMLGQRTGTLNQHNQANVLPFPEVLVNVDDEITSIDVIAERSDQPLTQIIHALLALELAGLIAAVPGGYVRLRR